MWSPRHYPEMPPELDHTPLLSGFLSPSSSAHLSASRAECSYVFLSTHSGVSLVLKWPFLLPVLQSALCCQNKSTTFFLCFQNFFHCQQLDPHSGIRNWALARVPASSFRFPACQVTVLPPAHLRDLSPGLGNTGMPTGQCEVTAGASLS